MHPQFPLAETERRMRPTWAGIPVVDVKSPGFFSPVVGMLQRKAAAVMVLSLTVFHVGIAWIVYRLFHVLSPEVRASFLDSSDVQTSLMLGGVWVLGLLTLACVFVLRLIDRQVTAPVAELARLSEAVASGELSVPFTPSRVNSEVGRLSRATSGMIIALRRLASTMRASARDTTTLSAQITTASESVAAAAQQTAVTSSALSKESSLMARTIKEIADDASKLEEISASLRGRAQENLRRERRLRTLAQENRERLDESSRALGLLTSDARASAESIEALATAVDEIRAFLTLVQKISRQSKLLALNAAMEAARAGEHGHGFAVVASEVRRLASSSADAAQRTTSLVQEMVDSVAQSREATSRTVATVEQALEATRAGRQSLSRVEEGTVEGEDLSGRIEKAVREANELISQMTQRLAGLSYGTSAFSRAMHEVAVSDEEQSKNIADLAAVAIALTDASARISDLVGTFKLGDA